MDSRLRAQYQRLQRTEEHMMAVGKTVSLMLFLLMLLMGVPVLAYGEHTILFACMVIIMALTLGVVAGAQGHARRRMAGLRLSAAENTK